MGRFDSIGTKALLAAAKEVKALANAQRTHVGRVVMIEPTDIDKLDLPERVTVKVHDTGYVVAADPDPLEQK